MHGGGGEEEECHLPGVGDGLHGLWKTRRRWRWVVVKMMRPREGGCSLFKLLVKQTDAGAVQTEQLAANLCDFRTENPKPEAEEFNEKTTKQKTT